METDAELVNLDITQEGGRSLRQFAPCPERIIDLPERRHFAGWGSTKLAAWTLWIPLDSDVDSVTAAVSGNRASAIVACNAWLVGLDLSDGKVSHVSDPGALEFLAMEPYGRDSVIAVFDVAVVETSFSDGMRWAAYPDRLNDDWRWHPGGVTVVSDDGTETSYDVEAQRRIAGLAH